MQYVYKFVDKALNMHYFKGREWCTDLSMLYREKISCFITH